MALPIPEPQDPLTDEHDKLAARLSHAPATPCDDPTAAIQRQQEFVSNRKFGVKPRPFLPIAHNTVGRGKTDLNHFLENEFTKMNQWPARFQGGPLTRG